MQLAIFDFDGTLADSFPFFLSVFNQLARQYDFSVIDTAQVDRLRTLNVRQVMRHVGMPHWKLPMASARFLTMMQENSSTIPVFEGVASALRTLAVQHVQLAIVTSNSRDNVNCILGPDLCALIRYCECGASIFGKASKIAKVLRQSGISANDAIYVGDQASDLQAARKVNVAFGAVAWGYAEFASLRQYRPDFEFQSVGELTRIGGL